MTPWLAALAGFAGVLAIIAFLIWLLTREARELGQSRVIGDALAADRERLRRYAEERERIRTRADRLRAAAEHDPRELLDALRAPGPPGAVPGPPAAGGPPDHRPDPGQVERDRE